MNPGTPHAAGEVFLQTLKSNAKKVFLRIAWGVFAWVFLRIDRGFCLGISAYFCGFLLSKNASPVPWCLFIVKPKNKETLSSPGRFGFLTEPTQSVLLILNFTIIVDFTISFRDFLDFRSESRDRIRNRSSFYSCKSLPGKIFFFT